jgi:hypothetical protein
MDSFTVCRSFQKPVQVAISGFWKAFHDSASSFSNTLKPIGTELENTLRKTSIISTIGMFKEAVLRQLYKYPRDNRSIPTRPKINSNS